VRSTAFERASGGGAATLDRSTSTREALGNLPRPPCRTSEAETRVWLSVEIDPEGATRFSGDLPHAIPPALAAAAAAAVEGEVDFIYGNVVDVSPSRR